MWHLWWGKFSLSISVSPANYSTDCSPPIIIIIIIDYPGPNSGLLTTWTKSHPTLSNYLLEGMT
jgi:hypothetical protein